MKKAETKFKERVLDDLKSLRGVWVLKTQEVARRGVPDLLICLLGEFVAIELKDDGESADPLQLVTLSKITRAGGWCFVADPTNWPLQFDVLCERHAKLMERTPSPSQPSPA